MKWIVSAILISIGAFFFYMISYLGYFEAIETGEMDLKDRKVIFLEHFGPYYKIVPKIQEIESWALANGVDCRFSFGEYYDDPERVEQDRLKSRGGCVVDKIPKKIPEKFLIGSLKGGHFFTAKWNGAPSIGPYKVYPLVLGNISSSKYKMQGWNVVEIYEVHKDQSMTTEYFFPVVSTN